MTAKKTNLFKAALYMILLTIMYYFNSQYFNIGIHFMYKGIICMAVICLAFIDFLIHPELERLKKLSKISIILILPNLLIGVWSMFSWAIAFTSLSNISRGLSSQIYQVLAVCAMAGVLYVFGKVGIWYNLAAMLAANLITIGQVIADSGFMVYMMDLWGTIRSFAAETGDLMQNTEVHELTFAIGLYLLYYLLFPKQIISHRLLAILTLFCYLSGFKRIGVLALLVAAACGWFLMSAKKNEKRISHMITTSGILITVAAFTYIVMIRQGFFAIIAENFGIDTMGRNDLYAAITPYYSLSPLFMGQGAGFVSRLFIESESSYFSSMGALHNDFLQIYVDIGFVGFFLWCMMMTVGRTSFASKTNRIKIVCFCITLCCVITYATDNTYYYPYVNAAAAILIMSSFFDEKGQIQQEVSEDIEETS